MHTSWAQRPASRAASRQHSAYPPHGKELLSLSEYRENEMEACSTRSPLEVPGLPEYETLELRCAHASFHQQSAGSMQRLAEFYRSITPVIFFEVFLLVGLRETRHFPGRNQLQR